LWIGIAKDFGLRGIEPSVVRFVAWAQLRALVLDAGALDALHPSGGGVQVEGVTGRGYHESDRKTQNAGKMIAK
jgi:hypothetical protein